MANRFLTSACSIMVMMQASASLAASPDLRHAVRSSNNNIVVNSFNNCVRSTFPGDKDECAPEIQAAVARRVQIGQEERTIYFEFNKFALTQEAVEKLNSLAGKLTSDSQVRAAKIVGYADRIGTPSYNEKLSKRRADNVRRYLVSRGFVKSQVTDTRWLGESVPLTQCPDSLSREELVGCLQKDRRVEVEIEYQK